LNILTKPAINIKINKWTKSKGVKGQIKSKSANENEILNIKAKPKPKLKTGKIKLSKIENCKIQHHLDGDFVTLTSFRFFVFT